jgi:hypothetical protein
MLRSHEQRQVLAELELTSTSRARAFVPVISTSPPDSMPPTGDPSPATYWRERFDQARPGEEPTLLALARDELRHIRRRAFPAVAWEDGVELAARVLGDGEGLQPGDVAFALRCTPTFVRRTRLANGREPEHGRTVRMDQLDARALMDAGMSLRQAAVATGVPRSTLAGRLARA